MYKYPICGKEFKKSGNHPYTHTEQGFIPWNKGDGNYRPESLLKMSLSQKARFKIHPTPNKGIPHTLATKLKLSLANRGKSHPMSDVAKKKMSELRKGKPRPPHIQKILRENLQRCRTDPVLFEKMISRALASRRKRPTSLERQFMALCSKYNLPYRYVGDGQIWIDRANPDFINTNGKKQVIEVLGRYWHTEEKVKSRVSHYKRYGFDCIPIWEEELKDETLILAKLSDIQTEGRVFGL